jgi:ABC-type amino acid transport system permease subunit
VQRGLVDAALSDQYILKRCAGQYPDLLDFLEERPYRTLPICWATRKGDQAWLQHLDASIENLEDRGWLPRLRAQYHEIPWATPTNGDSAPLTSVRGSPITDYISAFFTGISYTLFISIGAISLGTLLGVPLALCITDRRSQGLIPRLLFYFAHVYVYFFLAVPALVLIIMLYYNSYLTAMSATASALLSLGVNLSPFVAKIVASGIRNISPGIIEAAEVFGYSQRQIDIKFRFNLTLKSCLQPLFVQYFTTIKLSSLASVIGVTEILHRSQQVIRETYRTTETYLIVVVCYLAIVVPISVLADRYEALTKIQGARG